MTGQEMIDALLALTPEQRQFQMTSTYNCGHGRSGVDWLKVIGDQIYICESGEEPMTEGPE